MCEMICMCFTCVFFSHHSPYSSSLKSCRNSSDSIFNERKSSSNISISFPPLVVETTAVERVSTKAVEVEERKKMIKKP